MAIEGQALLSATGLIGASEPDDIDDADDGDILDDVVRPSGNDALDEAAAASDALEITELKDECNWPCPAAPVRSRRDSCGPPLPPAVWCWDVGTYKLL